MKKFFSLVILLISVQSFAQSVIPCITDELYVKAVRENPLLKIEEDQELPGTYFRIILRNASKLKGIRKK